MFTKKFVAMMALVIFGSQMIGTAAFADESVKEKAKETYHDSKRGVKKATREVKDKTCEMINGKMECAAKKVKHTIQNGADHVEDALD